MCVSERTLYVIFLSLLAQKAPQRREEKDKKERGAAAKNAKRRSEADMRGRSSRSRSPPSSGARSLRSRSPTSRSSKPATLLVSYTKNYSHEMGAEELLDEIMDAYGAASAEVQEIHGKKWEVLVKFPNEELAQEAMQGLDNTLWHGNHLMIKRLHPAPSDRSCL